MRGAGEFYFRDTGAKFVPRGNNLIRLAKLQLLFGGTATYHSMFNVGSYDASDAEGVLTRMQNDGYNTVRVFLSGVSAQGIGDPNGGLSRVYLANVSDFLRRAQAHGIFVLVSNEFVPHTGGYFNLVPESPDIGGRNRFYLTSGGIAAISKYLADLIIGLTAIGAPMDAVLGWDLTNELSYEGASLPLSMKTGTVATANGNRYDMASESSRQAMMDEGIVYFIDQIGSSIRRADPNALVVASFYQPQRPNPSRIGDTRLVRTYPAICCSTADFIDLHAYNIDLTLPQFAQNFELPAVSAKPIIMGEFGMQRTLGGSAENVAALLQRWQADSCAFGFGGWLLWSWDVVDQPDGTFWTAITDGGSINNALKPSARPDACRATLPENLARTASVSASREVSAQPAKFAVDGLPATGWSAGASPPQWIELKLPRPAIVRSIRLTVGQFPAGRTVHRLFSRSHDGRLTPLQELDGVTTDNQILTWTAPSPLVGIEAIRIETALGPSWVSWREIELLSGDSGELAITSIGNGATFDAAITPGSWVSILGSGLATSTRTWDALDFKGTGLPEKLDGVAVTFNGVPASVYYVSPTQLNVQAPATPTGQSVTVSVTRDNTRAGASAKVDAKAFNPGLFSYTASGSRFAASVFPDGAILGDPAVAPGTRSANAGDRLALYGTGFGVSAAGAAIAAPVALKDALTVTIGGIGATVEYAGLVGPGLFQINIVVPALPPGNHPVGISYGGANASAAPTIPIR